MFETPSTPPSSKGRTIAVVAIVLVAVAAGAAAFVWRHQLGLVSSPASTPAPATNTAPAPAAATAPDKDQLAVLETTAGRIVIEFFPDIAPRHTLAFQNMFRAGFFDGTLFHRVIAKQLVQGGGPNSKDDYPYDDGLIQQTQRRLPAELSTKVHHTRGMVSAAHLDGDLDSATSQFFIGLSTTPQWDGQYTIFGRVVEGMDVVDKMASAPLSTDPALIQRPAEPVRITKAYLAPRASVTLAK